MKAVLTAASANCVSRSPWVSDSVIESSASIFSSFDISSAPRGVRVEELGLYPAGGQAPDAAERLANVPALVLAYALFLAAAALALGAFHIGRPAAALIAIAAGAVALWLVLEGESALDAQALDEIEGQ
jgi:hypothetical protein